MKFIGAWIPTSNSGEQFQIRKKSKYSDIKNVRFGQQYVVYDSSFLKNAFLFFLFFRIVNINHNNNLNIGNFNCIMGNFGSCR